MKLAVHVAPLGESWSARWSEEDNPAYLAPTQEAVEQWLKENRKNISLVYWHNADGRIERREDWR